MAAARGFLLAIALATPAIAVAQPSPTPAPGDAPAEPPADPPGGAAPADDAATRAMAAQLAELTRRLEALEARDQPIAGLPEGPMAPPADWRDDLRGLQFGSYGRVIAGTDLHGGKPAPIHVAAHGPRIVEPSYLELDFGYGIPWGATGLARTVITLAYDDQLFHETGEFTAGPAIRNLYASLHTRAGGPSVWVGSRMLRGDDLYLLDFWPLDDLNTVGGGVEVPVRDLVVSAHVGVNRLLDPFQYQERDVADPELGATTVVQLNRQRMIASAKVEYVRAPGGAAWAQRARLYGEVHGLAAGERRRTDATLEALPRDYGTTLGLELSTWQPPGDTGRSRHANLFVRWSKGLAAFDELAAPSSFDDELETFDNASELVIGLGANWDLGHAGDGKGPHAHLTFAGYARRFVDADGQDVDRDDGWEYVVNVRPAYRVVRHVYAGVNLGYEARFPRGLQPTTQTAADPAILSVAPMVTLSPAGISAFARPQLRVVYRAAHQNEGALALYAAGDRRARTWTHFLGVQAEWWFNSNSYR